MNWHKISEELPPEKELVLVARKPKKETKWKYTTALLTSTSRNRTIWEINGQKGFHIVFFTHWTSIEPPEEASNEEKKENINN
jgi:hypothetical protein